MTATKLNWDKFKMKMNESWWGKLKPFIEGEACWNIYQELKNRERFIFPKSEDVWRAFKNVDYNKVRAIIVGQSPYHTHDGGVPYADGMAFSCSYVNKESPSMRVLIDAIKDDIGKRFMRRECDWHYLAFQDILLLNTCLTIDRGDKDSFDWHNVLWQPFIEYLFKEVLDTITGIPIILFGEAAKEQIIPYLSDSQPYRCVKHPAYYARKDTPMEHGGVFTWADEMVRKNNNEGIYWDYDEYLLKGLPF